MRPGLDGRVYWERFDFESVALRCAEPYLLFGIACNANDHFFFVSHDAEQMTLHRVSKQTARLGLRRDALAVDGLNEIS